MLKSETIQFDSFNLLFTLDGQGYVSSNFVSKCECVFCVC